MELITLWGALITARNDEIIEDYLALQRLTPLVQMALGRRWLSVDCDSKAVCRALGIQMSQVGISGQTVW